MIFNSRKSLLLFFLPVLLGLQACGGGSGNPLDSLAQDVAETIADDVLDQTVRQGSFVDSPVSGLRYTTTSGLAGITTNLGEFDYRQNDTVEFFIGDNYSLGSVKAAAKLTPFDLVGLSFPSDDLDLEDLIAYRLATEIAGRGDDFDAAVNRLILLQSLDRNNRPDDGIQIDTAVASFFTIAVTSLLFQQDTDKFISAFLVLFFQMVTQGILTRDASDGPVSEEAALLHFVTTAI